MAAVSPGARGRLTVKPLKLKLPGHSLDRAPFQALGRSKHLTFKVTYVCKTFSARLGVTTVIFQPSFPPAHFLSS